MAWAPFFIFFLAVINYQLATSQYIGPQIINRGLEIIEQINAPYPIAPLPIQTIISEPPCNKIIPVSPPSSNTILITDCSPSACQNLADTLNLMIVCNLLQNSQGGRDLALQLAGPVINQLITSPVLSCGCPNPVPNVVSNFGPVNPGNLIPIVNQIQNAPCNCGCAPQPVNPVIQELLNYV